MGDEYLVWLDLEMTGLNARVDVILEIATVITDHHLNIIDAGPELAIFANDKQLAGMNDWCKEHHYQSGLVDRVKQSTVSCREAEQGTLAFIKNYVAPETAPLCGNSIHQDRNFLRARMPELHGYLHYRNIDVSSLKELTYRWYPDLPRFEKKNKHTALEDIYESIEELKYYRSEVFK